MPSSPSFDWAETRRRNIEALEELSQADAKTEYLIDLLDGADYEEGGDEHILFRVDNEPNRIFKATYGDTSVANPYSIRSTRNSPARTSTPREIVMRVSI